MPLTIHSPRSNLNSPKEAPKRIVQTFTQLQAPNATTIYTIWKCSNIEKFFAKYIALCVKLGHE